jgi:N-hydroxyarylamine O-acetyltransferase
MVLMTRVEGRSWLCDVGFGGDGLLEPLELDGAPHDTFGATLRVTPHATELILQKRSGEVWDDLYIFSPEERYPIDFEVANWYTSTWPEVCSSKHSPYSARCPKRGTSCAG